MQRAQSDDRSRHAGLRPDSLTRKPRRGNTTAGLFAHQRAILAMTLVFRCALVGLISATESA